MAEQRNLFFRITGVDDAAISEDESKITIATPGRMAIGEIAFDKNLIADMSRQAQWALNNFKSVFPIPADIKNICEQARIFRIGIERSREADKILGIDWSKPESTKPYADMTVSDVYAAADHAKKVKEILEAGYLSSASMLRLLGQQPGKPKAKGRKGDADYDLAFVRWHIKGTHKQEEAFEQYIAENNIVFDDELVRADAWNTFKASLQNRRKAYEKGDKKLANRIAKYL